MSRSNDDDYLKEEKAGKLFVLGTQKRETSECITQSFFFFFVFSFPNIVSQLGHAGLRSSQVVLRYLTLIVRYLTRIVPS